MVLSKTNFKELDSETYSLDAMMPINQSNCTIIYNNCWMTDNGLIGKNCY